MSAAKYVISSYRPSRMKSSSPTTPVSSSRTGEVRSRPALGTAPHQVAQPVYRDDPRRRVAQRLGNEPSVFAQVRGPVEIRT